MTKYPVYGFDIPFEVDQVDLPYWVYEGVSGVLYGGYATQEGAQQNLEEEGGDFVVRVRIERMDML